MSRSWIRQFRLVIGSTNSGNTRSVKESAVISKSHIEFDITKTSDSKNNTAEIKIYNLADDTISLFDEKDVLVSLEVGYKDSPLSLIFRGNKTRMVTRKEETAIITTVQAADGYVPVREGRVNKAFPEQTTIENVLRETIRIGMPEVTTVQITPEAKKVAAKSYNNGYSVTGNAKRNLDIICDAFQLEWHIINNDVINILLKKGDIKKSAILLTPKNGLIESPEKTSQEVKELAKAAGIPQDKGIKFKCLLNPSIEPGGLIKIQDTFATDGIYKVERLTHRGSFEGDDWTTEVEGVSV